MTEDNVPYQCTLSKEMVQKAEKELNEKPEWRSRDIQALRDMVLAHKGLKCRTDDAFLLRFLRARKFDYDRAYQLLISYYSVREIHKDVLKELKPSAVETQINDGVSIMLPSRDKDGCGIFYYRPGRWDPNRYHIFDILRLNLVSLEKMILDEKHQVSGIVMIGNFSDLTLTHIKNLERMYAKIMTSLLQDAFPMRLKGVHAVNEPAIFGYAFAIIKPFLKDKFLKRMHFHGSDHKSLLDYFDAESLPQELGGGLKPTDELAADWKKTLMASEAMYEDMMKYRIELPRDITKQKNDEAMECLVGTYRKLDVD